MGSVSFQDSYNSSASWKRTFNNDKFLLFSYPGLISNNAGCLEHAKQPDSVTGGA